MQNTQAINVKAGNAIATGSVTVSDSMPGVPCPDPAGYKYVGARYVPLFADPAEWSSENTYEPLTIVLYEGNSYTSKQYVPVGIDIKNNDFWAQTGNYNAQVEKYREEVRNLSASALPNQKVYDSVASMLGDENISEGDNLKTLGYYSPGDGGSANYTVNTSKTYDIQGAYYRVGELYINLSGFYEITPEIFGAKGDGTTDDSEAFTNALSYLQQNYFVKNVTTGDIMIYNRNALYIHPKIYKVSNTLSVGNVNIIGRGICIIDTPGLNLSNSAQDQRIENVMFINMKSGIVLNQEIDGGKININKCRFQYCDICVDGGKQVSSLTLIEDCFFYKVGQAFINNSDRAVFSKCWVETDKLSEDKAVITNNNSLTIKDCLFVPLNNGKRWIDHYGNILTLTTNRFGGEYGGCKSTVYNYAKYNNSSSKSEQVVINIKDNLSVESSGTGIVKLFNLPNQLNIEGNYGEVDQINGFINVDKTLTDFPDTNFIKFYIKPVPLKNSSNRVVDKNLLKYVNKPLNTPKSINIMPVNMEINDNSEHTIKTIKLNGTINNGIIRAIIYISQNTTNNITANELLIKYSLTGASIVYNNEIMKENNIDPVFSVTSSSNKVNINVKLPYGSTSNPFTLGMEGFASSTYVYAASPGYYIVDTGSNG